MDDLLELFFDLPASATSGTWLPYALVGFMVLIAMCELITSLFSLIVGLGKGRF